MSTARRVRHGGLSAFYVLPVVGCVLMMGAMMWMMAGMGRHGGRGGDSR